MREIKTRIFSLILSLLIIFPFITTPSAEASAVWSGGVASGFAGGTGTQADPYIIANGEQFMYLSSVFITGSTYTEKDKKTKNKYFKITNDIDFDYKQITPIERFAGHLDGGNHTIKNINMYLYFEGNSYSGTSLFAANSGVITNLNVENVKLTGNKWGAVGGLCGNNNGTIEFCSFRGKFSFGDLTLYPYGIGGICANNGVNGVIHYCSVDFEEICATENNVNIFGGIAAESTGTITGCSVSGNVNISTSGGYYIGGCVGKCEGTIEDSYSTLDLSFEGSYMRNPYVGGIVGYGYNCNIKRCGVRNTSILVNQNAPSGYISCGGVAGYLKGTAENCYFIGSIYINLYQVTKDNHGIGGITGYTDGATIKNCYATGTINRAGNSDQTKNYVAGITGYSIKCTINNCFASLGMVNNGVGYVGTISGRTNSNIKITNTYYSTDTPFSGYNTVINGTGVASSQLKNESFLVNMVGLKKYTGAGENDEVWLYGEESAYVYPEVYSVCNAVVKYDANGGTGAPNPQYLKYKTTDALSANIPVRKGYVFKCWSTSPDSDEYTYNPGDKPDGYMLMGCVTLYAIWEKGNTLSVSEVKANNGIFTAEIDAIGVKEASKVYLGVFDSHGRLQAVAVKPVDAGDSSFSISTEEKVSVDAPVVKVMLWNTNMRPDGKAYIK